MTSLRDIRQKIGSVRGTQQITRAMTMMASVKLRRAMERLQAAKFYLERLEQIVADIMHEYPQAMEHEFGRPRPEIRNIGIVVIAGERGLCGSFNHDIFRFVAKFTEQHETVASHLILIGKKAREHYRHTGLPILAHHQDMSAEFFTEEINNISRNAIGFYQNGTVDELYLVHTVFHSPLERTAVGERLLPLQPIIPSSAPRQTMLADIEFMPDPQTVFCQLIPRYVQGLLQKALLESSAAEESARMLAMTAATDKAQEMLDEMRLRYNRTRQSVITTELIEVTAGAEAMHA